MMSRLLYRYPALLFYAQRRALEIADSSFDLQTAFRLYKRPEWVKVPKLERSFRLDFSVMDVNPATDIPLAKRIIISYGRALADMKDNRGVGEKTIWKDLSDVKFSRMHSTIVAGDPLAAADFFSRVFQSEAVDGFAMGTWYDATPHRWWLWGAGIVTSIVCLAEALGLARAECPEQGQIGYVLSEEGLSHIFDNLDRHFGCRIETPRIGSTRGISVGGRFISRETCSQIHTAARIRRAFDSWLGDEARMQIVEVGGGYGGLCYWLMKLCGDRIERYHIVDLPATALIQSYVLGTLLKDAVSFYGESNRDAKVILLPHFALDSIPSMFNVLINQDSMPEMPPSEVERYLDWGSRHLDGLFFSFNQEAFSIVNGSPQLFVPARIASHPSYQLISRNTAWDRRGYVEEIYLNTQRSPNVLHLGPSPHVA